MNLACKNALLRRDVAHLIFPDEVQTLPAPEGAEAGGPDGPRRAARRSRRPRSRSQTRCGCCAARKRPVIIVGHGARFHMAAVIALAEQLGAPVITTFKAKGQIGDDHPLAAGVLGRSGTPVASWVMNEADLLLVLGASFSNHTGIYAGHPIIQVDFDPMQLGKFHPVDVPVWGEVGVVVERLRGELPGAARRPTTRRRSSPSAGRSGAPRRRSRAADDRGARRQLGVGVRRDGAPDPRRRRDRRRRRQPRLLVRPLLRVQAPHGADVRLPRLDRLRLPGRDGRVGRGAGPADRRGHRRRRLRASTWPSSRPRSSTA